MHQISIEEQKQEMILKNGLITADRFVNKNYLIHLSDQEIVPLAQDRENTNTLRFYRVNKLVYDKKENLNDKLISVYSALQNVDSSAIMMIDGNKDGVSLYIGVKSNINAAVASKILEKSFMGNFPGTDLTGLKNSEIAELMDQVTQPENFMKTKSVSSVTVVPSMRDEDKDKFVQGMEKFIDTMQGETYTVFILSRPVGMEELESKKRGYEQLYSSLSPFVKTSLAYGVNYSKAVSRGMFENFSHSVNNSIANTTGYNTGSSSSHTDGSNTGFSISGGGFSSSSGNSSSDTVGYSSGKSWSQSVSSGTADTTGTGTNTSDTETSGSSRTMTVEHQNKGTAVLLEKIEQQLKRMNDCEAYGVWECASYFIADDIQTSVVAANTYKALMCGDNTNVENSFINVWGIKSLEKTNQVLNYLRYGRHPLFDIMPEQGFQTQRVSPGNFISGKELPFLMGIPHKSVSGVTVSSIAQFGRNVYRQDRGTKAGPGIEVGDIYHMGRTENRKVKLDLNSFTSHCFITGSTGSGKSNTTYCLLERFLENNIPFLVIEPAKGEYKTAFGDVEGIDVFTTNPLIGQMLKINPFRFEQGIHILEHLDRLIEIFNACWEMYAAMPAILKDAVEKSYIKKGWDLFHSVFTGEGEPEYPDFTDLLETLPEVIRSSSYSSDTQGDYTGALVTRVKSLTNGISGQIFCDNYDIDDRRLFDGNVIVDLSRVGSTETKSLLMGLLVLKLSEYRMANAQQANSALRHITVMEEAHNLLKRANPSSASSGLVAKSVEMICNSIAEMRTYGEGFVIVDQSPTAVDIAAIKNTNTKILMRLPEMEDCKAVANAVSLDEDQTRELSKLSTGVAVVMQNNWLEAVLTKIDRASERYEREYRPESFEKVRKIKGDIVIELLHQFHDKRQMDYGILEQLIGNSGLTSDKKRELEYCLQIMLGKLTKQMDTDLFASMLMNFTGCKNAFEKNESIIKVIKRDGEPDSYDMQSVLKWKKRMKTELHSYMDIPEDKEFRILTILVYRCACDKSSRIMYSEILKMICK